MTTALPSERFKLWHVCAAVVLALFAWSGASYLWPGIPTPSHEVITVFREDVDFSVYFSNLGWVKRGQVLFEHGYAEYPVAGLLYVNWPHYITGSFEVYHWLLWLSNAGLFCLSVWLWWRVGKLMAFSRGGWWLWILPSSLYFTLNRFDIFPVAIVLLSLYLLARNKLRSAWVVYGLSIMTKVYPIFLLPMFWQLSRERGGTLGTFLVYTLSSIAGLLLGVYVVGGPEAVTVPFMLQLSRGVDYGSLRALIEQLGLASFVWPTLSLIGQLLMPVWWGLAALRRRFTMSASSVCALAALTLLILTNLYPFYSNQWWLWALPFVAWALPPQHRIVAALYDVANYVQFPIAFELWGKESLGFADVVLVRTALAAWLVVLLWHQLPQKWWSIPQRI